MSVTRRDALRRTAALAAATLLPSLARGQAPAGYPNQAIRFVVPYAPGGFPDTVARILAQRLSDRLGQSVVIDNRPGANGGVAAGVLTSAPADGYQFLVTDGSMFSINPLIYSKLTYDPKKDFVPVALVARAPLFLALHPKVPANNLKEFLDYVKAQPGQGQLRVVGHRQHASPHRRGDEDVARPRHGARPVQGNGPVGAGTRRRSGRDAVLRLSVARRLRQGRAREAHRDQRCAALVACARPAGDLRARARFRFRADRRRACTRRNASGHHPEDRHRSRGRNQDAGCDPADGDRRASIRSAPARTTMRKRSRARTRAWRPRSRPPE